jgi:hypothetical protein
MVMQSAVLILPTELKLQGNTISEAMGWGSESYTIPLSDNDFDITHYALRADVDNQFIRWITRVDSFPIVEAELIIDSLIYDFAGVEHNLWGREHLEYVCNNHNLTIIGL